MRKHITPAHPRATIFDPTRDVKLPPEGADVTWSTYWARLEMRGDVTVTDIADEAPVEAERTAEADGLQGSAVALTQSGEALGAAAEKLGDAGALSTETAEPAPFDPKPEPAPGTVASVPFMTTAADRKRLKALGKSDDEIRNMKPEEVQAILADQPAA